MIIIKLIFKSSIKVRRINKVAWLKTYKPDKKVSYYPQEIIKWALQKTSDPRAQNKKNNPLSK